MADIAAARRALLARILEGAGKTTRNERRAAFGNATLAPPLSVLIDKVVRRAHEVSDADIAAVRASGLGEDQIFETVVCAAVGEASRQYETALAALDAATREA
jgi:hypothetical protein